MLKLQAGITKNFPRSVKTLCHRPLRLWRREKLSVTCLSVEHRSTRIAGIVDRSIFLSGLQRLTMSLSRKGPSSYLTFVMHKNIFGGSLEFYMNIRENCGHTEHYDNLSRYDEPFQPRCKRGKSGFGSSYRARGDL